MCPFQIIPNNYIKEGGQEKVRLVTLEPCPRLTGRCSGECEWDKDRSLKGDSQNLTHIFRLLEIMDRRGQLRYKRLPDKKSERF